MAGVGRTKHALLVTDAERAKIRDLYLGGARLTEIVTQAGRSMSSVQKVVRGLKRDHRPWPKRSEAIAARNEEIVAMWRQGATLNVVAQEFGITATRVWQIVGEATGKVARRIEPPFPKAPQRRTRRIRMPRKDARRRNRQIRILHTAGVSVAAIARRFGMSAKSVRKALSDATAKKSARPHAARNHLTPKG